jgi:hypothetical protein
MSTRTVDDHGIGSRIAIYHALTQFNDFGMAATESCWKPGRTRCLGAMMRSTVPYSNAHLPGSPSEGV